MRETLEQSMTLMIQKNMGDDLVTYIRTFFFSLYLIMAFSLASECALSRSDESNGGPRVVVGESPLSR